MKIRTVQQITLQDWDRLVEETYGRPYSFQQQDDCKPRGIETIIVPCEQPEDYENSTVPEEINGEEMGVSFAAWLERDPKQRFEEDGGLISTSSLSLFWERNFYPHVDMVANDLHARGLLPAGEYQIVIDW